VHANPLYVPCTRQDFQTTQPIKLTVRLPATALKAVTSNAPITTQVTVRTFMLRCWRGVAIRSTMMATVPFHQHARLLPSCCA
jgi:hypothetical protein